MSKSTDTMHRTIKAYQSTTKSGQLLDLKDIILRNITIEYEVTKKSCKGDMP